MPAFALRLHIYWMGTDPPFRSPFRRMMMMAYMNYEKKISGLGPVFQPMGDVEADMAAIKAFYAPFKGKYAGQFYPGAQTHTGGIKKKPVLGPAFLIQQAFNSQSFILLFTICREQTQQTNTNQQQ